MSYLSSRSFHRLPSLVASVLLALLVLAPSGAASAQVDPAADLPPGAAWVRVGHFVPGMGTTSVEVTPLEGSGRSTMLARSATYSQVSAYDKLTPGRYTATVRETSAAADAEPLLSRTFEVTAGQARTVAVVGTSAQPRLVLLVDDLTPPGKGTARVRFLSASRSADMVTVEAVGGPTVAKDAVLGQVTPYADVPAGNWDLQLSSATLSATDQQVPITSGSVYTVVALDQGDQKVALKVVTDAAGAMVPPRGGARTGDGGTATQSARPVHPATAASAPLLLLLAVGSAAALVRRRRRSAR